MAHLKQRQIDSLIKAGKAGSHSDGGGLILRLNGKGAANWLHRYQMNGKRRDMGLGSYPTVSLADARAKVAEARKLIADGKDPITERDRIMNNQEIEFEWNPERELNMNLSLIHKILLTIIAGKTPNEIDILFEQLVSQMETYTGYGMWLERQPENHDQTGKPIGAGILFCINACCAFSVESLRILKQQPNDARLPYYISRSMFYAGQAYGLAHGTEVQSIYWTELRAKGGTTKAERLYGDEKTKFLEAYAEFKTNNTWQGHRWKSRANAVRDIRNMLNLTATDKTLDGWAKAFDDKAKAQNRP